MPDMDEVPFYRQSDIDQLSQLLREKNSLMSNSTESFPQIQKLVDVEIWRIRQKLFQDEFDVQLDLPDPQGPTTIVVDKLYLPTKDNPDFNYVGRIIGPRGMTAKQLERTTGCKIMIRGKGSMRDNRRDGSPRSRMNYQHLDEELHVILQCDDTVNRAEVRIAKAKELINKIVGPPSKASDDLKRKQLIELAILNGTYREKSECYNHSSPLSIEGAWRRRSSFNTSPPSPPASSPSARSSASPPTLDFEFDMGLRGDSFWQSIQSGHCMPKRHTHHHHDDDDDDELIPFFERATFSPLPFRIPARGN